MSGHCGNLRLALVFTVGFRDDFQNFIFMSSDLV